MDGQLGNGTNTNSNVPVNVIGLSTGITSLGAGSGGNHTCAVQGGVGPLRCWGSNSAGQLGTGDLTDRQCPGGIEMADRGWAGGG